MEKEKVNNPEEKLDYEKYVVRKALSEYWRADEKVELVLMGFTNRIPVTMLCKLNNLSPSQYYEWREKFIAQGKEGLMGWSDGTSRSGRPTTCRSTRTSLRQRLSLWSKNL